MAKKIKVTRFSAQGEPSPNAGKYALIALAAVVLLIAGFLVGKSTSSGKNTTAINTEKKSTIGDISSKYGPSRTKGIVPVGFDRSSKGAVTAATAYVALTPKLYFANDKVFNTSVVQLTAPTYTQTFVDAISASRTSARQIYTADNDAFLREFPMGYFVQSEEDDRVVVVVWSTFMVAARPDFDGKTETKIHVLEMVWNNNDWKVNNWVTRAGPTPKWQAPPSSILPVDEFLTVIEPFQGGFDYVPSF